MRKLLLLIALMLGLAVSALAKDTYARNASALPKAAQSVLARNCKAKVSLIKIDKDFGRISEYEVILTDGTEITFDRNGNWESIEVGNNKSVPDGFVTQAIRNFVKNNHKGTRIVGIERDRSGYDVELSDGLKLKFDRAGNFKRYDD